MNTHRALRLLLIVLALLVWGVASWAAPTAPCIETNTPFQQVYSQQAATQGTQDIETYAVKVRSYRFISNVNMTLCSIGYQFPGTPDREIYSVKIKDVTFSPGFTVYRRSLLSPGINNGVSYQATAFPLSLVQGHEYELTVTAPGPRTGRVLTHQVGKFPMQVPAGDLQILHSTLRRGAPTATDVYLPFIDFGTY